MTSGSNSCSTKGEFIFCSSISRASTSICGALVSSTSNSKRPPRASLSTRCRICAWLPRQNFTVTPYRPLKSATSLSWSSCVRDEYSISSPSLLAAPIMRSMRSAPWYEATARIPGVGSTAKLAGATARPSRTTKRSGTAAKRLEPQQARGALAQDLGLLQLGEIFSRADVRDGMRKLRIEVRIVARHEYVIFADLGDRPHEIGFVCLAGHVTVAAYVLRGRHLEHARDLRKILRPFPVVVHAVHPVKDPLGAALEEHDLEPGEFLEHAAEHQRHQRRGTVGRASHDVCLEKVVEPVDQLAVAVGMAQQRNAELFRRLVVGVEARVVQIARSAIRHEVRSPEAELLHAAAQLIRHGFGTARRRHCHGQKHILVALHQFRDPVVEQARALASQPADVRGRDGDLRREYQLLVDTLLADVLATACHIVAAHLPRRYVAAAPMGLRVVYVGMPVCCVALRADRVERMQKFRVVRAPIVQLDRPEALVGALELVDLVHEIAFAQMGIEVDDHAGILGLGVGHRVAAGVE